ncbi:MAG: 50S ribosomal protein L17 [Candidatus Omnitrophica bacterium]|nr:50S ribosomal protein L17 [Candidatus Omnitrophota bacterium]
MRHATRSQRLSLPSEHRQALLNGLVKSLIVHGEVKTTLARAKEAQRLADRLVTLGKDGSLHARRRAFRVLQDRTLVKRVFAEIAPRYVDVSGGYTRVVRLALRQGDGAQQALLALSRLPAKHPAPAAGSKPREAPQRPSAPTPAQPQKPKAEKPATGFFQGLRDLWTRKKKWGAAS